jgi:RNA 3'-terminal phosphate cyclase (ATP)
VQINKPVHIDGRNGEGGGQILRTALTLSAICGVPLFIHHIRGNRKRPGLRPQHLIAVNSLATITRAGVQGAAIDSHELFFEPEGIYEGNYSFHIGTAGSTGLVLQAIIPVLLFGNISSRIHITGGTHVPWSPSFHYLRDVFLPFLKGMGGDVNVEIDTWGWYPKGGGTIRAVIRNSQSLIPVHLVNRGALQNLSILSAASNLPISIAKRQMDQSIKRLKHLHLTPTTTVKNAPSSGQGTVLFLHAQCKGGGGGFTSLGKRGKRAEEVANSACDACIRFLDSSGVIDSYLADQLVLYMSLAKGHSTIIAERITKHLLTNIWVIEKFLPISFDIDKESGKIEVEGVGFKVE